LDEIRTDIAKLKISVENGLTKKQQSIEESVKCLTDCMAKFERTKEIEDAQAKAGFQGFFEDSWTDFKKKFGWIIILIILWLFVWGFVKVLVFKEYPFPTTISPTSATSVIGEINER
jgi:hypothetical protein